MPGLTCIADETGNDADKSESLGCLVDFELIHYLGQLFLLGAELLLLRFHIFDVIS